MTMDAQQTRNILEACLLVAGKAMNIAQLEALFESDFQRPDRNQIKEVLTALQAEYEGRGIELVEVASGWRLQSRASMEHWVGRLFQEKNPRYSRALLETLVLIAYRQPITRGEIEEVRGVAVSSNIIKTLQEREWVKEIGYKDVPGKPALWGTTRQFLDYFNLKRLDELPTLAEARELEEIESALAAEESLSEAAANDGEINEDAESVNADTTESAEGDTAESAEGDTAESAEGDVNQSDGQLASLANSLPGAGIASPSEGLSALVTNFVGNHAAEIQADSDLNASEEGDDDSELAAAIEEERLNSLEAEFQSSEAPVVGAHGEINEADEVDASDAEQNLAANGEEISADSVTDAEIDTSADTDAATAEVAVESNGTDSSWSSLAGSLPGADIPEQKEKFSSFVSHYVGSDASQSESEFTGESESEETVSAEGNGEQLIADDAEQIDAVQIDVDKSPESEEKQVEEFSETEPDVAVEIMSAHNLVIEEWQPPKPRASHVPTDSVVDDKDDPAEDTESAENKSVNAESQLRKVIDDFADEHWQEVEAQSEFESRTLKGVRNDGLQKEVETGSETERSFEPHAEKVTEVSGSPAPGGSSSMFGLSGVVQTEYQPGGDSSADHDTAHSVDDDVEVADGFVATENQQQDDKISDALSNSENPPDPKSESDSDEPPKNRDSEP